VLKSDGTVVAWGYNGWNQCDVPLSLFPYELFVEGTVVYDSATFTAIFTPLALLDSGVPYVATVNTGAHSSAGGALAADVLWNFIPVSPLVIPTLNLPNGAQGVAYSQTLVATGGKLPYTWSISAGALPAGLSLSASTGIISGTPTATADNNSFTAMVTDANNSTATQGLSIIVPSLVFVTSSLPDGYRTVTYNQTLTATGGRAPYTWSRTSGSLPSGLTLNTATGIISGVPTQTGSRTFTIQVRDSANVTRSKQLTIVVYTLPSISTSSLPNGTLNVAYNRSLAASNGKIPYTWSVVSGSLPPGLILNPATGAITGTPTSRGTFPFTAKVVDANGKSATKALSISII
jgi:hypothetical protein